MRVFKKGKYYHYEFEFERKRYQGSTHRKNEREAIQMAGAIQFNIMKRTVGLGSKDPAPTIRAFQKKFERWVDQDIEDPGTQGFYKACYRRFVECTHLADVPLSNIDEPRIEKFKTWALSLDSVKTKTTVNRYLATLSKALHYAADKLRLIERVPKIHKYPKSKTCERERDFTFSDAQYKAWAETAPEPLRSCSVIARECGMSRNELLALQKDCVHLKEQADARGFFGLVNVRRGLKRESRKRKLPITAAMREVLTAALARSKCKHVLTGPESADKPMSPNTIENQIKRTRLALALPTDAGLHALRQYIHPEETDIFGIVAAMTVKKLPSQPQPESEKAAAKAAGED